MQVKPIKNKQGHKGALRRIEDFWGSEQGTEDGDLLDDLEQVLRRLGSIFADKVIASA